MKDAGLTAYNHNLDTSREYYPEVLYARPMKREYCFLMRVLCPKFYPHSILLYSQVITTRTYDDRLETLEVSKLVEFQVAWLLCLDVSGCSLGRSLRVLRRHPWSGRVPRRPRGSPAFHSHPTLPPGVRTYQLSRTHRRYLQVDKIQLLRLVNAMYCTVATGTPMKMTGKASPPTALELTRMIATARLVLPTSMVRLSAGRMGFTDAEQVCGLN